MPAVQKGPATPIPWVDVSKGLGIYLVVLGHANIRPTLEHFIYLFHMPLFFFLSGYLHTVKSDFGEYLKKKAVHLLLPYVSFLVLLYPLEIVRSFLHHGLGPELAHVVFAGLWGGNQLQSLYGVFWFLPCLFLTQQLMNFLLASYRLVTVSTVVLISLLLSYANALLAPQLSLPLDVNVVLAAAPFFYLGFITKRLGKQSRMVIAVCALGAISGACLVHLAVPISYNMRIGDYGIPGLSLALAICCIVCVIVISRLSVAVIPLERILSKVGAASLGIMFIHKQLPVIPFLNRWAIGHAYLGSILYTGISFFITELLQRAALTRALLLGSETDFRGLFGDRGTTLKWGNPARTVALREKLPCAE